MKRKKLLAGVVCLISLLFLCSVTQVYAYKHGEKGRPYGKKADLSDKFFKKVHIIYKNQEELGVSDEQLTNLKTIKIRQKKELIRKKADIDIIAVDIKAMLWEDKINLEAINKLIDEKYELKKTKAKVLVEAYSKLKDLLSEEQKTKLKEFCMMEGKKLK